MTTSTSESEQWAVRYVMQLIGDIQYDEVEDWLDREMDFSVAVPTFRDMVDGVMDAIKRIDEIEIKES